MEQTKYLKLSRHFSPDTYPENGTFIGYSIWVICGPDGPIKVDNIKCDIYAKQGHNMEIVNSLNLAPLFSGLPLDLTAAAQVYLQDKDYWVREYHQTLKYQQENP